MKNAYDNEKNNAENIERYASKDESVALSNDAVLLDDRALAEKKVA